LSGFVRVEGMDVCGPCWAVVRLPGEVPKVA
jgi:hypothetical protein